MCNCLRLEEHVGENQLLLSPDYSWLALAVSDRSHTAPEASNMFVNSADRTLAEQFANCENNAQQRASSKRKGSMGKVRRLDGATALFSKKARERIPAPVIDRIKEINWLDIELHEVASEMANEMIRRETAKGMQVCT